MVSFFFLLFQLKNVVAMVGSDETVNTNITVYMVVWRMVIVKIKALVKRAGLAQLASIVRFFFFFEQVDVHTVVQCTELRNKTNIQS